MTLVFKCTNCGLTSRTPHMLCPICGSLVHPVHGWKWSFEEKRGIWSFSGILPRPDQRISLGEGYTPLIESSRLFHELVFYKDEGRNPTGSFRDRAAALVVSDALSRGAKRLVLASDGNMGASVAAYGARAGLPVTVYVPQWVDPEKIMIMKAFGANVIIRDLELDELLKVVSRRSRRRGLYNASSTYNSLSIEGLKTIAIEIVLQMGRGPKEVVLPLGSGLTILSLYHGFREMVDEGHIAYIPKLIGVETCGNPFYASLLGISAKCSEEALPGLSYTKPIIRDYVVNIIEKYGEVVVVRRSKVVEAAKNLAQREGLFVEPSSAVALAGALNIGLSDYTVIVLTGHGLKGPSAYREASRTKTTTIFPGSTKKLIIDILKENTGLTGYEVWKRLGLKISVQAVYQHLHDLLRKGYLEVREDRGLKLYYLRRDVRFSSKTAS